MNNRVTGDESETPLCPAELQDLAQGILYMWQHSTSGFESTELMRGLQFPQYVVMRALRERTMRMTELAELTQTSSANVTGMVDRLVERGLASREHDPSDRRVVRVSLTPLGAEGLREQGLRFQERLSSLCDPLEPVECREFVRLLAKIAHAGDAPEAD